MRALGQTRADFVRTAALRGLFIGAVAAVVAAVVAIAGSTLMPIGPLRALDPHRGVDVDVTVLSIGVIAVVLLLTAHGMFIASRRGARASVGRHRLSDAVTGRSSSPTVVTGVGFALDPGRGDAAIPVRSTAFGVGLAVSALVATIVFAAGLTHFTTTPKMYGWIWSYQVEPGGSVTAATLEHAASGLKSDPRIQAEAVGAYAQLTISGKTIGAVAVQSGHDVPIAETLNGRAPQTPDEIVLGAQTLRSLHRGVGDTVAVNIGGVTRPFQVVGRAVFPRFAPYPASEPTGLGVGAAMTLDGLTRFGPLDDSARSPLAAGPFVLVDAKSGTSSSVLVRLAFHGDADAGLVLGAQRPSFVESYQHLERTPLALAGLLVALADRDDRAPAREPPAPPPARPGAAAGARLHEVPAPDIGVGAGDHTDRADPRGRDPARGSGRPFAVAAHVGVARYSGARGRSARPRRARRAARPARGQPRSSDPRRGRGAGESVTHPEK